MGGEKISKPNIPNTKHLAHCYRVTEMNFVFKGEGNTKRGGREGEKVIKNKPLHTDIAISPSLTHKHTNGQDKSVD